MTAPDIRGAICGALLGRPSATWEELPAGTIPALAARMAARCGGQPSSRDKALRRYLHLRASMGADDLAELLGELGLTVTAEKSTDLATE